jgi:formate/nitrite transporter FocA (FNT family)
MIGNIVGGAMFVAVRGCCIADPHWNNDDP